MRRSLGFGVYRTDVVSALVMEDYCQLFGNWLDADPMFVDDLDTLFGVDV